VRLTVAAGPATQHRVAITPAVRSALARLVLRRSAPPRGSGRGGDTAGGSGALAARGGLDLLFVSDHDSTVNLPVLQQIASSRGVSFIPGIELSPSWGHFNAYPLAAGARLRSTPARPPST